MCELKILDYRKNQPNNSEAWRLGIACRIAAQKPGGDAIDQGLELMLQLEKKGFGVVVLPEYGRDGD